MRFGRGSRGAAISIAFSVGVACSERVNVGFDRAMPSGGLASVAGDAGRGGDTSSGGTAGTSGGVSVTCEQVACRGKVYACGDCDDNDQDSSIDALDPECLGPCDDTEDVFASPTPGGMSCRLDCAFDRNSGAGNDRCDWDLRCDPLSPGASSGCESTDESLESATCVDTAGTQPEACVDSCEPLTPNGCDCFGCCELPARSGRYVWIGSGNVAGGCSLERVDDPDACPACTPVPACENRCDVCEACVGGVGPSSACATPEEPVCGSGTPHCAPGAACGSDRYCVTGCCIIVPS